MMNIEQVNELKARAEKAVSLARTISEIDAAKMFDDLPWEYRDRILEAGKRAVRETLETRLNDLLGVVPVAPPSLPVQDLRIGTLDTSNEQPEPGNSWESKAA